MQISERVRLVGSGELGFQTSHPLDCNVFLLDGGTDAPQETSYPCLSGTRSTDWCGAYHSSRIRRAVLPKPRAA